MRKVEIAPSVLSLDYSNFNQQCHELNSSNAKFVHFDVMDGHFVPNLTFGPDILKGFRKACPDMVMDVHLMVENPDMFIESFVKAGADYITFHVEAMKDAEAIHALLDKIHGFGVKAGLVIKPKTSDDVLDEFLEKCDMVLVMSVEPGFGGQKFMEDMLVKVSNLRNKIDEKKLDCLVEIDGGINDQTGLLAKNAGVDVMVAGSYVFKGDIHEKVNSLL